MSSSTRYSSRHHKDIDASRDFQRTRILQVTSSSSGRPVHREMERVVKDQASWERTIDLEQLVHVGSLGHSQPPRPFRSLSHLANSPAPRRSFSCFFFHPQPFPGHVFLIPGREGTMIVRLPLLTSCNDKRNFCRIPQ